MCAHNCLPRSELMRTPLTAVISFLLLLSGCALGCFVCLSSPLSLCSTALTFWDENIFVRLLCDALRFGGYSMHFACNLHNHITPTERSMYSLRAIQRNQKSKKKKLNIAFHSQSAMRTNRQFVHGKCTNRMFHDWRRIPFHLRAVTAQTGFFFPRIFVKAFFFFFKFVSETSTHEEIADCECSEQCYCTYRSGQMVMAIQYSTNLIGFS